MSNKNCAKGNVQCLHGPNFAHKVESKPDGTK